MSNTGCENKLTKAQLAELLAGNSLEWFDFAVYGALAPIISELFFPKQDKLIALLLTYGIFFAGFIARPFVGCLLSFFVDKYGN